MRSIARRITVSSLALSFLCATSAAQQPAPSLDQVNMRAIGPPVSIASPARSAGPAAAVGTLSGSPAPGTGINFDDGTPKAPINGFYADLGITFSNAAWKEPIGSQNGTPSSGIFLVDVTDDGFNPPYSPSETSPIVAVFHRPVNTVSVLAVDVGMAGATLRAYDGVSGGNLIAEDTFFGTGIGVGQFDTLTVTELGIRRIELFQPLPQSPDGLFFDNLTFGDAVVLDFETGDDFETPLVNGLGIPSAGAFGELVSISGLSASGETAAIFDTTPAGLNGGSQDPDLLVDLGNALILQTGSAQTVPGRYDFPNDDPDGGDIDISFLESGAHPLSVDLIDICPDANQTTTVTMTDGDSRTLVYRVPSGWTEDIAVDGPLGYRTLDLTTTEDQPGFISTATANAAPGFNPDDVVSMRISFEGSGAVDNLIFRPRASALTVETFESFPEDSVLTTEIPGLTISAGNGIPTVVDASNPVIPNEPLGLAHLPFFEDLLQINFEPSTSTVGAFIDFGSVGNGVRMVAYSGPDGTGQVLGSIDTQTEEFIGVDAKGIRSVRFEGLFNATYLIDNLTYSLELPNP